MKFGYYNERRAHIGQDFPLVHIQTGTVLVPVTGDGLGFPGLCLLALDIERSRAPVPFCTSLYQRGLNHMESGFYPHSAVKLWPCCPGAGDDNIPSKNLISIVQCSFLVFCHHPPVIFTAIPAN